MNAAELASQLNGAEYPFNLGRDLDRVARDNGLVVVYGSSDDLMEFEGAIRNELYVTDGDTILIHPGGVLGSRDDLDTDEKLAQWLADKAAAKPLSVLWCGDDVYSWTYRTDIPHSTFDIVEGDEKYCKGIVFCLHDL